ncbi:MAG: hypothetical protein CHACPFDD_01786 [Phycisphaerae bacterium]|nr:hypothetical protein [Phycisphaerae bacterium]
MFGSMHEPDSKLGAQQAFDMLSELERNTPDEIRRQRAAFRIALKTKVVLQPGNASDMNLLKLQGVTGDISEGGCRALFPLPPRVGDVYRLTFDRGMLDLPLTFARVVRCYMLREDAFEVGFRFFNQIAMPEKLAEVACAARV